ncbi:MAG: hypothetical protein DYG98_02060 [Haliscomenobacteraceae bacterium CHB4]|nr:hypothetical protein [Saprospiraceae bacterium]MCE7921816.1 hypothetical protein [Haliscomenobacteraceae bacterium CHB4]
MIPPGYSTYTSRRQVFSMPRSGRIRLLNFQNLVNVANADAQNLAARGIKKDKLTPTEPPLKPHLKGAPTLVSADENGFDH